MAKSKAILAIVSLFVSLSNLVATAQAVLITEDTGPQLVIANDRLYAAVNKTTGAIQNLLLDGQDLLGDAGYTDPTPGGATGNGASGVGPYLDCYCVPDGFYTPEQSAELLQISQKGLCRIVVIESTEGMQTRFSLAQEPILLKRLAG